MWTDFTDKNDNADKNKKKKKKTTLVPKLWVSYETSIDESGSATCFTLLQISEKKKKY